MITIETLIEFESAFLSPQLCAANHPFPFPGADCSDSNSDTSADADSDSHCAVANAVYYDLCDLILSMDIECSVETIGLNTYYNKTSHGDGDNDLDRIHSESPLGIDANNALSFRHGEMNIMNLAYSIPNEIHSHGLGPPLMELYLGDCAWIDQSDNREEAEGRDKRINLLRNLARIEPISDHWRLGHDSFTRLDPGARADPDSDSDPDHNEQRHTFGSKEAIKADFKIVMSHDIQDYTDALHFQDNANASPRYGRNVRFEPYPTYMHTYTHPHASTARPLAWTWSEAFQSIQYDPVLCVLLGLLAIITVIVVDVVIFLVGDSRPKPGSYPFLFGAVRTGVIGIWMGISLYGRIGRSCFVCMGLGLVGYLASWNKLCCRGVHSSLCKVWLVSRVVLISIGAGAVWVQEAFSACLVSVVNVPLEMLQFPSRLWLRLRSSSFLDEEEGNQLQLQQLQNTECDMNMRSNMITPPHQKKSPSCPTACPVTAYKPRTVESEMSGSVTNLRFVSPDGSEIEAEVSPSTRRLSGMRTLRFDMEPTTLMEGTDMDMYMHMQPRVVSPRNVQFKNDRNIRDRQLAIYEDLLVVSAMDELNQSFAREGGIDMCSSVNVDVLDSVEGGLGGHGGESHLNSSEGVEDILNHELVDVSINVCANVDAASTGSVKTAQYELPYELPRDDANADGHGGVNDISQSPLASSDMNIHSNGVSKDDEIAAAEHQECVDETKSIQEFEGVESHVNTSDADMPNDELQCSPVANIDSCNNVETASVGLIMTDQEELPRDDVNTESQNEVKHPQTPFRSSDMSSRSSAVSEDSGSVADEDQKCIDDAKSSQESGGVESHEDISKGVGDVPNDEFECSPVINNNVEAMTEEEKLPRDDSNVESRHGDIAGLQTTFKNCHSDAGEHKECVDDAKSIQDDESLIEIEHDNADSSCISVAVMDNSFKAASSVHKCLGNSEMLEPEKDCGLRNSTECDFSEDCGVPVHEEEVQDENIAEKSVVKVDCVSTEYFALDPIASFTSVPVEKESESDQEATYHLDEGVDTTTILRDTDREFLADPPEECQTLSVSGVEEICVDAATEASDSGKCNKLPLETYAKTLQGKDPVLALQSVRKELFAKLKTRSNFVDQQTISSRVASPHPLGILSPSSGQKSWPTRSTKPNKLRTPDAFIVKNDNANTSPNLTPRQRSVTNNISQLVAKWSNDGEASHSEAPEAVQFSGKKVRKKIISPFHHKDKQKSSSKPKKIEPLSGVDMGSSGSNAKGHNAAVSDTALRFLDEMLG